MAQGDVGMIFEKVDLCLELSITPNVIGINKGTVLPARLHHAFVACDLRDEKMLVSFLRDDSYCSAIAPSQIKRAISRAIIDNNHFKLRIVLSKNAIQTLPKEMHRVERRNHNADEWQVHDAFNFERTVS